MLRPIGEFNVSTFYEDVNTYILRSIMKERAAAIGDKIRLVCDLVLYVSRLS